MKSQKGITLTSIIIYITIMILIIGIISVITSFFYKNIEDVGKNINPYQEITRFNSYFIEDINKEDVSVLECKEDESESYVILSDGIQYTFKNHGIYRGKVKICDGIYDLKFKKTDNAENTISVIYKLTEDDTYKTTDYNT